MRPARLAYRVSSSRSLRQSFCRRFAGCLSTVLALMKRISPVSFDVWPSATS